MRFSNITMIEKNDKIFENKKKEKLDFFHFGFDNKLLYYNDYIVQVELKLLKAKMPEFF